MSKVEQTNTKDTFWEIVNYNDLYRDALVPAIAWEDRLVRSTVEWLDRNEGQDEAIVENCHSDLEGHIVRKYGLPPELSEMVFLLCRDLLWKGDFDHGNDT